MFWIWLIERDGDLSWNISNFSETETELSNQKVYCYYKIQHRSLLNELRISWERSYQSTCCIVVRCRYPPDQRSNDDVKTERKCQPLSSVISITHPRDPCLGVGDPEQRDPPHCLYCMFFSGNSILDLPKRPPTLYPLVCTPRLRSTRTSWNWAWGSSREGRGGNVCGGFE